MCLFCRILEGEIPATVVAETTMSLAFRDVDAQAPTHVLVIPRRHVPSLGELAAYPDELADVVTLAVRVAGDEGLHTPDIPDIPDSPDTREPGYRLVANTGSGAGQTVFHAHLHLLGGRDLGWPPG